MFFALCTECRVVYMHYIRNSAVGRCVCVIKSFMQLFHFDNTWSKNSLSIYCYTKVGGFIHKPRNILTRGQDITEISLYKQNVVLRYWYSTLYSSTFNFVWIFGKLNNNGFNGISVCRFEFIYIPIFLLKHDQSFD